MDVFLVTSEADELTPKVVKPGWVSELCREILGFVRAKGLHEAQGTHASESGVCVWQRDGPLHFTSGGISTWHSVGGLSHFSRLSQKCSTCCPFTSAHSLS